MEHTTFQYLPAELLHMIGSHLTLNKLFIFRAGCRRFKRLWPEQTILQVARRQYPRGATGYQKDKLCVKAIKRGDLGFLKLLVRCGYRFPKDVVMTCVLHAPREQRLSICRYLMSLGYSPTGLRWAVSMARFNDPMPSDLMELIKLLTSKGDFTKATTRDCLQAIIYCQNDRFDVLKHLLFLGTETTGAPSELRVILRGPFLRFLTDHQTDRGNGIRLGKRLLEMIYPRHTALYTGDTATDLLRGVNLLG